MTKCTVASCLFPPFLFFFSLSLSLSIFSFVSNVFWTLETVLKPLFISSQDQLSQNNCNLTPVDEQIWLKTVKSRSEQGRSPSSFSSLAMFFGASVARESLLLVVKTRSKVSFRSNVCLLHIALCLSIPFIVFGIHLSSRPTSRCRPFRSFFVLFDVFALWFFSFFVCLCRLETNKEH